MSELRAQKSQRATITGLEVKCFFLWCWTLIDFDVQFLCVSAAVVRHNDSTDNQLMKLYSLFHDIVLHDFFGQSLADFVTLNWYFAAIRRSRENKRERKNRIPQALEKSCCIEKASGWRTCFISRCDRSFLHWRCNHWHSIIHEIRLYSQPHSSNGVQHWTKYMQNIICNWNIRSPNMVRRSTCECEWRQKGRKSWHFFPVKWTATIVIFGRVCVIWVFRYAWNPL